MKRTHRFRACAALLAAAIGLSGGCAVEDVGPDAGHDAGVDSGPMRPDVGPPPEPQGRVVVGHRSGTEYRVDQYDARTLEPTPGSPYIARGAYRNLVVAPDGRIALAMVERDEVTVIDGATMQELYTVPVPVEPSGFSEDEAPLSMAFDLHADRLMVYERPIDGPGERAIHVFEGASGEVIPAAESPIVVTYGARYALHYDPVNDRVIGFGDFSLWMADYGTSGAEHTYGAPENVRRLGSSVVDLSHRRLYYSDALGGYVAVRDLDSFAAIGAVNVAEPGEGPRLQGETRFAFDPENEEVYALGDSPSEDGPTQLLRVTTSPLQRADLCGSAAGCELEGVHYAVAFDPVTRRLFTSVRGDDDDAEGELSVWEVPVGGELVEVDGPRPPTGPQPSWVATY